MPNIATALKTEISRLARKEVRAEIEALKRASSSHRGDIAALKRQVHSLEQQLRKVSKTRGKAASVAPQEESETRLRFSAKGFASLRSKLGISAAEMGQLLDCSDQSVYKWERGEVKPRASQLPAIAAVRALGKKDVSKRLEALRTAAA